MKVIITTEHRFIRLPNGTVCSVTKGREYEFWQRYLSVFDEVLVVARVQSIQGGGNGNSVASGPLVEFCDLASYKGVVGYLRSGINLKKHIHNTYTDDAAYIMRVPGQVSNLVWRDLNLYRHPYAVEVVGDPYDVFSPSAVKHPLRRILRYWFSRLLRLQCSGANVAAYVTAEAIQRRYPAIHSNFQTYYSSVELPQDAFVDRPKKYGELFARPIYLVSVGSMEQMYKGFDTLIDAIAHLRQKRVNAFLTIVGDGKYRLQLEEQVEKLGISDFVKFTGMLPAGRLVREQLDNADLFILSSRTEGLPRVVIEAMARGLPCVATNVGGLSELLPAECLVPANDSIALAKKIADFVSDPNHLTEQSRQNLQKASEYESAILQGRRIQFYQHVRNITESWLKTRPAKG